MSCTAPPVEVNVWRVDRKVPKAWDRTWPDGEYAPGVKMVSLMQRADGMTHEQFVRHWTENHAPLALTHHVGLWNYTQNVVRRDVHAGRQPASTVWRSSTSARGNRSTPSSSTPTRGAQ